MDTELKSKWVKALRSGEYKKGLGCLRSDGKYCCLGVLAEIVGLEFEDRPISNGIIDDGIYVGYRPLIKLVGNEDLSGLWFRNDGSNVHREHSFAEIADYIEANIP